MTEPTPERHDSPEHIMQERAHGWVAALTESVLAFDGEAGNHVEYNLNTDQENVAELLDCMRVGDLLIAPGGMMGEVPYAEYSYDGQYVDKMGLWHDGSFIIPPEPTRIFISALSAKDQEGALPVYSLGIGLEYSRGSATYKQLIGLIAEKDYTVTATCLAYGERGETTLIGQQNSRPHTVADTREFIACMEDIVAVARLKL